jgi:hypothetical protein
MTIIDNLNIISDIIQYMIENYFQDQEDGKKKYPGIHFFFTKDLKDLSQDLLYLRSIFSSTTFPYISQFLAIDGHTPHKNLRNLFKQFLELLQNIIEQFNDLIDGYNASYSSHYRFVNNTPIVSTIFSREDIQLIRSILIKIFHLLKNLLNTIQQIIDEQIIDD